MAKKTTRTKKRAQLPLTQQPRSFMDMVSGTSRLSREPAPAKQSALATVKTGLSNLKSLAGQLPHANPFAFDDAVAKQAKDESTKNRTMKKRSKKNVKESKSEEVKDKEMNIKEGGVKDLAMDEKARSKKRAVKKRGGLKYGPQSPSYINKLQKEAPETLSAPKPGAFGATPGKTAAQNYQAANSKFNAYGDWATESRKKAKNRSMPQRRTNKTLNGLQLLHKATDKRR